MIELQVFLSNPEVFDTNHVERELRPQAVGRKPFRLHELLDALDSVTPE